MTDTVLHADWPAPPGVHAMTTLRHGAGMSQPPFDSFNMGLRCGDDADAVRANRSQLVDLLSLPSEPHWLRQVHGVAVAEMDAPALAPPPAKPREGWEEVASAREDSPHAHATQPSPAFAGEGVEADASVTASRGMVLAILTADCLPVVFSAADGTEIAVAHAGWRGLASGVLEATIAAMHTVPENIMAWLGPAAGPDTYEIGEEVFDAFVSRDPRSETAFTPTRPGHWRVDLNALARMRLAQARVTRVHGGNLCTISDPQRFYSHRRDQRTGRMATLIWRE